MRPSPQRPPKSIIRRRRKRSKKLLRPRSELRRGFGNARQASGLPFSFRPPFDAVAKYPYSLRRFYCVAGGSISPNSTTKAIWTHHEESHALRLAASDRDAVGIGSCGRRPEFQGILDEPIWRQSRALETSRREQEQAARRRQGIGEIK